MSDRTTRGSAVLVLATAYSLQDAQNGVKTKDQSVVPLYME